MQGLLFLSKIINNLYKNKKGKQSHFNSWKYLNTVSLLGMGRIQGLAIESSGEENVVNKVIGEAKENKLVIIDVGANIGQYTSMVIEQNFKSKNAELHLFEPSAKNVALLSEKFKKISGEAIQFYINQLALSDTSQSTFLYTDSEGSDLGSLYNLKVPIRPFDEQKKETIRTTTLDQYATEKNIDHIHLLKVDVEGAEYNVLLGAQQLISEGKIKNIQFEFGPGNISSKRFFHDFWEMLSDKYDFFQVVNDGFVPIKKYSIDMEVFITVNYFLTLK